MLSCSSFQLPSQPTQAPSQATAHADREEEGADWATPITERDKRGICYGWQEHEEDAGRATANTERDKHDICYGWQHRIRPGNGIGEPSRWGMGTGGMGPGCSRRNDE